MGFDWTSIENSFPAFREDDPPQVTARKLHDYLYRLMNQLKFTLQNLNTENWNAKALKDFSADTVKDVSAELVKLGKQMSGLLGSMNTLLGRVAAAEGDIAELGEEVTYLQVTTAEHAQRLDKLEENVSRNQSALAELDERTRDVEQMRSDIDTNAGDIAVLEELAEQMKTVLDSLTQAVQCTEEQTTVGKQGKALHLVGDVYINGVLYAQGGA